MKKRKLETILENVPVHPNPKPSLEQYSIPTRIAAEILFIADQMFNDIKNKSIVELGCGTGRLSIGAALLGAHTVVAVDIDPKSIYILRKKRSELGFGGKIRPIVAEIDSLTGRFDTAIQNPPFGVKKRGADKPFIIKALEISKMVYSLHKKDHKSRYFIKRMVQANNGEVTHIFEMKMQIPRIFPYHKKRLYEINVDLYRMVRNG